MELPDGAPARVDGQQPGAVVNPLSDGGSDGTKDSNAVLSFFPKEHRAIGKAYSNAGGGPSLLYRWVQLVSSVTALFLLLRGEMVDELSWNVKPSILGKISQTAQAAQMMVTLLPVAAARRVLREGGELDQLGCGRVKISEADAQYLVRWRLVLTGIGCFCSVLFLLLSFLIFGVSATRFRGTAAAFDAHCEGVAGVVGGAGAGDGCTPADRKFAVMTLSEEMTTTSNGKFFLLNQAMWLLVPTLCAFMYTNMLAATLARDSVTEVISASRESDPSDKEGWMESVAKPALRLEQTMDTLSRGWGRGFLGVTCMAWSAAFFAFCQGVNQPRAAQIAFMRGELNNQSQTMNFVFSGIFALFPLLFLTDVASTSNRCDQLLDELNDLRKKWGPRCNEEITWLETSLMRLNRGQGLGFTITGIVIDRRFLKNLAMAIGGGMTTLITAVVALSEEAPGMVGARASACAPTAAQVAQVKLSFGGGNCSYANLTVGSML
eukprot:COSAG04_NODE_798_length_10234_cov_8.130735_3_plen_492_part_00